MDREVLMQVGFSLITRFVRRANRFWKWCKIDAFKLVLVNKLPRPTPINNRLSFWRNGHLIVYMSFGLFAPGSGICCLLIWPFDFDQNEEKKNKIDLLSCYCFWNAFIKFYLYSSVDTNRLSFCSVLFRIFCFALI